MVKRKTRPVLLCAALSLCLTACAPKEEAVVMDPTVTVRAVTVQTGSLSTEGTYVGTVSAEGTAAVVPLVSGEVEKVHVSVGDTVTAGQALCVFDDTSARLQLASAQASYQNALVGVENAQAGIKSAQESYQSAAANYGVNEDGQLAIVESQLKMARDNLEATKALFEIGAASQIEVDQAQQSADTAEAGLQAAQAQLAAARAGVSQAEAGLSSGQAGVQSAKVGLSSAEYQLSLYHLAAPISGVVEAVNVTEHNFAASGNVAFVISNAKNKTVTFYVTNEVKRDLRQGQAVTVTAQDTSYSGTVTEISGVVDAAVGLFQVKAVIADADDLPDGLAVQLTTTSHAVEGEIVVPNDALYYNNGAPYVYLLRDGKAVQTEVAVGLHNAEYTVVLDGLTAGDQVITTWSAALRDETPVRLEQQ